MVWYRMPWINISLSLLVMLAILNAIPAQDARSFWPALCCLGWSAVHLRRFKVIAGWGVGVGLAVILMIHADQRDVSEWRWVQTFDSVWEGCFEGEVGSLRQAEWGITAQVRIQTTQGQADVDALFKETYPQKGAQVQVCGEWRGHLRASTPWAIDWRGRAHRRGLLGRGTVKDWVLLNDSPDVMERFERWVTARRFWVEDRVRARLENPWAGLVIALTTGNKAWMDAEVMQAYADTGTSHVLAISGLHFGVVAGLSWWASVGILRRSVWVGRHLGARVASAGLVVIACVVYMLFVGAPVSAQRASVGVLMLALAVLGARHVCPFHVICVAGVVVLVAEPLAIGEIAFQLSFAATFGIILFNHCRPPWLRPGHGKESRVALRLRAFGVFLGVSVAASLATLPVLVGHFGFFSMWSLPLNVVVVPLVSIFVFPLMLVGHGLSIIHEGVGAWVMGFAVHPLVLGAGPSTWFARMAWANWVPGAQPLAHTLAMALSVWVLLVSQGQWRPIAAGSLIGMFAVLAANDVHTLRDEVRIDFIDVGQGDSTLVMTKDYVVLVDAGGRMFGRDPGRAQVVPYLRQVGVEHIDLFVITHADLDHRGGARAVLDLMQVGALLIHPAESDPMTQMLKDRANHWGVEVWNIEDEWVREGELSRLRALIPPADLEEKNDRSIVLEVKTGAMSVLLTGDLEHAGEMWWVAKNRGQFDFLKMPHHGSHTSSSVDLLQSTRPRLAMSSAGVNNAFNHPRPDVVDRYHSRGIRTFHTHEVGVIRAAMNDQAIQIFHR